MVRKKGREITGVYPQSLQDPRMGGSRLAKMADEEEELGTSGHEVEHLYGGAGGGEICARGVKIEMSLTD